MDRGTKRRAPAAWGPGALLLLAAAAVTAILAFAGGLRDWPWAVGLFALVLLLMGVLERLWEGRPAQEPPPPRRKHPARAGRSDYDLEGDDRTDSQRWLM